MAVLFSLLLCGAWFWWNRQQDQGPAAPAVPGWVQQGELWHYRGKTIGTSLALTLRGPDPKTLPALTQALKARLKAVNAAMSTYDPNSEISVFNGLKVGHSVNISEGFGEVLVYALQTAKRSEGAFDPTVGPLVRAWGFGAGAKAITQAPSAEQLASILPRVGYTKLSYNPQTRWLTRAQAVELDLSAVAKGYGVDVIQALLLERGLSDHMIEIGGEVCVSGRPDSARPWRIGIEAPSSDAASARKVMRVLELDDECLATSGDYRSYLSLDGQKRQHTIDPRSGASVRNGLASVSVLSKRAMHADAWATAMMVLGPKAAMDMAKAQGLEILMVVREDAGLEVQRTPGFARRMPDAQTQS